MKQKKSEKREKQKNPAKQKNPVKRMNLAKPVLIALACVTAVLLAAVCLWNYLPGRNAESGKIVGGSREASAVQGTIEQMSDEEIQQSLDSAVENGMFRIHISGTITADSSGNARADIQNNPGNKFNMQVTLFVNAVDNEGKPFLDEIYSTDLIKPGYCIENITFPEPLPSGEYTGIARFTAFYPDTDEIAGVVNAEIRLRAAEKEEEAEK